MRASRQRIEHRGRTRSHDVAAVVLDLPLDHPSRGTPAIPTSRSTSRRSSRSARFLDRRTAISAVGRAGRPAGLPVSRRERRGFHLDLTPDLVRRGLARRCGSKLGVGHRVRDSRWDPRRPSTRFRSPEPPREGRIPGGELAGNCVPRADDVVGEAVVGQRTTRRIHDGGHAPTSAQLGAYLGAYARGTGQHGAGPVERDPIQNKASRHQTGRPDTSRRRLLIRRFWVQVPGGAQRKQRNGGLHPGPAVRV